MTFCHIRYFVPFDLLDNYNFIGYFFQNINVKFQNVYNRLNVFFRIK